MKIYQKIISLFLFIVAFLVVIPNITAFASIMPTFSLNYTNSTSSQITVYGDPNSTVELHYGSSASNSTTIGSTDQNGNLSIPISSDGYAIGCGQTAYVVVDGQQSTTIPWVPNNNSCRLLHRVSFRLAKIMLL